MIPKKQPQNTPFLFSDYETLLNHKNPLFILANNINWPLGSADFLIGFPDDLTSCQVFKPWHNYSSVDR
jgi:hypothetical protein